MGSMARRLKKFLAQNWHYGLVLAFGIILTVGLWGLMWRVMIGDDYRFHFVRLQSAYFGWKDGQIVPQVNPEILGGMGYAYNLFYGPLVTYVAAILRFLISSWPLVVNLIYILTMIGSGVVMCWVMMRITKKKSLATISAVLYMMAPYHLANIYSRSALGELAAFCFVPILLLGLYMLVQQQKQAARYLAIAGSGLLLTHNASIVVFGVMAALYLLLNIEKVANFQSLKRLVIGGVVALGLSAFFWMPMLEAKFSAADYGIFNSAYAKAYFGASAEAMNEKYLRLMGYGAERMSGSYITEQNITIGILGIIALVGYWFVRQRIGNKSEQKLLDSLYVITLIMLVIMGGWFPWQVMPGVFWQIQFPWRFLGVVMLTTSILAGYVIYDVVQNLPRNIQKTVTFLILLIMLYPNLWYFAPNAERHLETGETVDLSVANSVAGSQLEYAPMGLICPNGFNEGAKDWDEIRRNEVCGIVVADKYIKERSDEGAEVLTGDAEIKDYVKDGTRIELVVQSGSGASIELPLVFYPGYKVHASGVGVGVSEHGLVLLELPEGFDGRIEVYYGMSGMTMWGLMISIVSVIGSCVWIFSPKIRHKVVKTRKM